MFTAHTILSFVIIGFFVGIFVVMAWATKDKDPDDRNDRF